MASPVETEKPNLEDQPIPGPPTRGPDHIFQIDYERPLSPLLRLARFVNNIFREPILWVRENVVEANRGPKYYWYHRKFPRALPIDECYFDDTPCIYEADLEFQRNHQVDRHILNILQQRRDNCEYWWTTRHPNNQPEESCLEMHETYKRELVNFHIKYGALFAGASVLHAYNKQKHLMIVDRRRAEKEKDGTLAEQRPDS